MSTFDLEEREVIESAARAWWVFLLTGLLWLLFAIIVLRFDYTTVTAVSILFGIVAIAAGINEFFMLAASHRWWKVLHGLLGVIFVVVGIIAFVHPGDTFAADTAALLREAGVPSLVKPFDFAKLETLLREVVAAKTLT